MSRTDDPVKAGEDSDVGRARESRRFRVTVLIQNMTTDTDTLEEGNDGIDYGDHETLMDLSDEEIANLLEEQKQQAREAVNDTNAALLNGDEPLTDDKLHELWSVGDAVSALSAALIHRVPPEHQAIPPEEKSDSE